MAKKKLRVGLIGLGAICQGSHIPGWLEDEHAEIVAAADPFVDARKRTMENANIGEDMVFEDYKDMLEKVDLDIVDICTPQLAHVQPTVDAFAAGLNVLVEKPAATCVKDVQTMIDAGHKAGKMLMVAQSYRYFDEALALRRWVDDEQVGDIYWARASYMRSRGVPAGRPSFILKSLSAGGPVYDLGVHILDLCLYLMGHPEPVSVSANVWVEIANKPSLMKHDPKMFEVPDEFTAGFVRFANGACISLETSWALNYPENEAGSIFLAGTKGGIKTNPATLVREEAGMLTNTTVQVNPDAGAKAHRLEIHDFTNAIVKGLPSPVPGEDALMTQRILDGIYKSAEKGKEVTI